MIVGYIHATTGALVVSSNYKCTDFLPVVAGTVYSATNDSITRPTFYDANKVRTGIAGAFINFTIPEGSAFMRLSFRQSTTNVMLNYGATVLPFVPYSEPEYRLKTGYKRDSIIEDFITDSTVKASIDQYIKEKNGLYGLKWGALGDSQTQYGNPITSYVDYVEASTGIVGINYGVGSTTIAVRDGLTSSFYERAQLMATDLDIITVMGGINDSMGSAGPVPIGTMADRVATTFYGACHLLFVYLMETYIGKKIGVMTSIAPDSSALGLNYANVLKEVAAYYSLPLLDIWNESGINAKTETLKAQYMGDGLHPTALGREMISRRIVAFLKSL
jgi:lysophospholipase L1-like esterase